MKVIMADVRGIDFTSTPTKKKPIICARCTFDGEKLTVQRLEAAESLAAFEALLSEPDEWIAGIDFPFGQPRKLLETLCEQQRWPLSWTGYVEAISRISRDEFGGILERYKEHREKGDREHLRAVDRLTRSQSPSKWYGVPVGKMFFEGAQRLLRSPASILPMRPSDDPRLIVEAYPALVARVLVGSEKYKPEAEAAQSAARSTRQSMLTGLSGGVLKKRYGFAVKMPADIQAACIDDKSGDSIDAVLAAVQAAWALAQSDNGYGIPQACDVLEGWIVDPSTSPALTRQPMIGLSELLTTRGFKPDGKRVKLVRHKDSRLDLEALRSAGWLETYQQFQSNPVFDRCEQLVVFFGEEGFDSRFIGIYDVGTRRPADQAEVPAGFPHPEWASADHVHYELTKRAGFEDLEDRLVVDWGKNAINWHQWYSDRPVVEIRPRGRALPPFRDYLRVNLTFSDLKALVTQSKAHRDWVTGLSAVGGIYLIVNGITGAQYVGSATGASGIWGRWCEYGKTGHGHNQRLMELCKQESGCPGAFRFSILETFSRSLSRDEALSLEYFFKEKLGTRAFGLNAN